MEGRDQTAAGGGSPKPALPPALLRLERALRALADRGQVAVPPYPAVALRVQHAMARKGFGLHEVADLIAVDAGLAADLLRCANSVVYRRGEPVIDLTQALARIGVQQVTRLLQASGLAPLAQAPGALAPLRRMYWIEALSGAVVCQDLARLRSLRAEEAFTLGLLHDFGKVVAVSGLEALLEQEGLLERFDREPWEQVVEALHQPLGLALAGRWTLPATVSEIIAAHHGGGPACSAPRLLAVVEVSDRVVALLLSKARVSSQDLAGVPGLAPAERAAIGAVLEQIPDFVVAFETHLASAAEASPRISTLAAQAPVHAGPNADGPGAARPAQVHGQGQDQDQSQDQGHGQGHGPAPDQPPVPARGGRRIGVSVMVTRRPRAFSATAIGEERLVMWGEEPLPENRLLEAKVHSPVPFSAWVLTRSCQRDGAGFVVEARPFALTGPLRERWIELVAGEAARA